MDEVSIRGKNFNIRCSETAMWDIIELIDGRYIEGTDEERFIAALRIMYPDFDMMNDEEKEHAKSIMEDMLFDFANKTLIGEIW